MLDTTSRLFKAYRRDLYSKEGRRERYTIRALGEWASTQFSHSAVIVPVTQSLSF